ncbi:MAG: hypothetical protein V4617_07700 [Gemmatimonadota bacterium]
MSIFSHIGSVLLSAVALFQGIEPASSTGSASLNVPSVAAPNLASDEAGCGGCTETYDGPLGFYYHVMSTGGTEVQRAGSGSVQSGGLEGGGLWKCNSYDGKGCHTGGWLNTCESGHSTPCWLNEDLAEQLDGDAVLAALAAAARDGDDTGLQLAAKRLGAHLRVNVARKSLQVDDCNGKVIANIPARSGVLAMVASASMALN